MSVITGLAVLSTFSIVLLVIFVISKLNNHKSSYEEEIVREFFKLIKILF